MAANVHFHGLSCENSIVKIVVVIGKNLLDLSRVGEVARGARHSILTSPNTNRLETMLSAGPGDREFIVIFDYNYYKDGNLADIVNNLDAQALEYGVDPISYRSFVPHEKKEELAKLHPKVDFVARSAFFRDLATHLA